MEFQTDSLGNYIKEHKEKNKDLLETNLLGVTISKKFIPSIANTNGTNFKNYKIISYNDFVYGPVTSRNGDKISIALFKEDNSIVSQSYKVFSIIDENLLNPDFLMLWFEREEFDRYARFHSHGSTREVFTWKKLCDTEIPVPNIENQDKIVQINETILKRIKIKEKLNNNLEQLLKACLKELFNFDKNSDKLKYTEEFGNIPNSWTVEHLIDYVDFIRGFEPGSDNYIEKINNVENNLIKFFRVGDLKNPESPVYINKDLVEESKLINEKDIVLSLDATIGIVSMGLNGSFSSGMRKIMLKNDKLNKAFVYTLLKTERVQNILKTYASGTTILHASKSLNYITFMLPDQKRINKYKEMTSPILDIILSNMKEIQKLTKLRDTLLPKLMSGEIDVSGINFDL